MVHIPPVTIQEIKLSGERYILARDCQLQWNSPELTKLYTINIRCKNGTVYGKYQAYRTLEAAIEWRDAKLRKHNMMPEGLE